MADSMRVGKTTAVGVLAHGLRDLGYSVSESYEDWQHNPYLQTSYEDPSANFLDSQKWFARRKWEQLLSTTQSAIILQDVAPEMDFCYAATNYLLGRINEAQFGQYDSFYRSLDWSQIALPRLLIYLQVSDEELLRRARASRREFESVDDAYFLTMKYVNRKWLSGVTRDYAVFTIDTDTLDFAHSEKGREQLLDMVKERIGS
jgi:deoxyadenosine/deoxycytidine kinase